MRKEPGAMCHQQGNSISKTLLVLFSFFPAPALTGKSPLLEMDFSTHLKLATESSMMNLNPNNQEKRIF